MTQFIRWPLLALLALAACDGDGSGSSGGSSSCGAPPVGLMNAASWSTGPIIGGRDYSPGAADPIAHPEGWAFDIPQSGSGEIDGIFYNHGPLTGKTRITIRYRVEGTRIVSSEQPDGNGTLALFFQRRGDDWSGQEAYQHYRWYSLRYLELTPGEHEIVADLSELDKWISVWGAQGVSYPTQFQAAMDNAGCVGIVLGRPPGLGHGVYALGRARVVVTHFGIE